MTTIRHEGTGSVVFLIALLSLSRSEDILFPQLFSQSGFQEEQTVTGRLDAEIILPCSFKFGSDPVIYWRNQESDIVHSFYKDADQIVGPRYINRTSLFHNEIKSGNASLSLKRLRPEDEGTYTCYVGTSFGNSWGRIVLKLEGFMAPLIQYEETTTGSILTCSVLCSQPCPNFIWEMDGIPISDFRVEESGFYVYSTINIVFPDSFYECAIVNSSLKQTWTGGWTTKDLKATESKDVSLLCELGYNGFKADEDFEVTWSRVQSGKSSVLASFQNSSQMTTISESRLLLNEELIKQGTITSTLTTIAISDSGEYLCNISSNKYTLLTTQMLYVEPYTIPFKIIVAVVAAVAVALLVVLVLMCRVPALRRHICCCQAKTPRDTRRNKHSEQSTCTEESHMMN